MGIINFYLLFAIGAILFIFHLISIYEINGIINAIEEEIISSAKSYLRKRDREPLDDFYQNFNKLNNKLPNYSVFFVSSFLSNFFNECFGYLSISIFITVINCSILYFGFNKFKFNLERNPYKNYNLNEFIYLFFIYFFLSLFQGITALFPLKFIKDVFIFYDKYKEKKEKIKQIKNEEEKKSSQTSNNSQPSNNSLTSNNSEINRNFKFHKLKGFFIYYLICISISIILKIILDKVFIDEYTYSSRKKINRYFIINYLSLNILSCIFYILYSAKMIQKERIKGEKIISSMKLCGYIIYNEEIASKDICGCNWGYNCCECFEDCKICCQTLNLSLCCCCGSCSCFWKCIFCCKCKEIDEINQYRMRKIEDINKIEKICVFYRVTGRWNWLAKTMTDIKIYILTLILYYILITNIGFEDLIWSNIEKNKYNKDDYIINVIILGSIFVFYFINFFGGKLIIYFFDSLSEEKNGISNELKKLGEFKFIFAGYFPYIFVQTIVAAILSGMIYFREKKNMNNYVLSIATGSVEYIKINILEIISFFIETNIKNLEVFSSSTIFSVYLFIWDIILFILDVADVKNISLIKFQFFFGTVFSCILFLFMIFIITIGCRRYLNNKNNFYDSQNYHVAKSQSNYNTNDANFVVVSNSNFNNNFYCYNSNMNNNITYFH